MSTPIPEIFSFEGFELQLANERMSSIQLVNYVGRGKYSDVYQGIDTQSNQKLAIKILKPIRQEKIKREVKIASMMRNHHILPILDVMKDPCTQKIILSFPFYPSISPQSFHTLPSQHIPSIMHSLLSALDHSHSQSVMHRDIKPHNMLINPTNYHLMLIDWGLAQFFMPGRQYSCKVASRYFKAPQLIFQDAFYGPAIDIWAAGCVFGAMIYRIEIFFKGKDSIDQILKIANWFGKEALKNILSIYRLNPDATVLEAIEKGDEHPKEWESLKNNSNKDTISNSGIDLLKKMLTLDKNERITAEEALLHPYFDTLKLKHQNEKNLKDIYERCANDRSI